jgi:tRNA(Ile)-lysidine synthase
LQLAGALAQPQTLLVAFSGGLDSRVLLQLAADLRPQARFRLRAMHVHHGLSANADDWAEFCRQTCAALDVPLDVVRIDVARNGGLGIEAAARAARYQALLNAGADWVLLAHHEDDQAETLLLQLLRGAGAKGLSAMAAADPHRRLLRPLLDVTRAELERHARDHGLRWIEDESNADIAYDRNYCRHEILPVMARRFPAVRKTLARSARHLAEAAGLLDALASLDAAHALEGGRLRISALAAMDEPRARNLLRWWLSASERLLPNAAALGEILRQLVEAKADANVRFVLGERVLRRYRGYAWLERETAPVPIDLTWHGETEMRLPDGSRLSFERRPGAGLAWHHLDKMPLRICNRQGGEHFRPDSRRPTRTLKHLLQEAAVPPWQRQRLPLLYLGETLAIVPGIGTACALQAAPHEEGLEVRWQP